MPSSPSTRCPIRQSSGAAKAWMATEQYAQRKALLLSLTYS
ncbi:hypothetical protein [Arthrobacter sp. UYCu723]